MDKVVVLMSTYNGEKYLSQQIDSILCQKNVDICLLVRDDGSSDNTIKILQKYQENGKLEWYSGQNIKPAKSFMDLIYNAPDAKYYAFSDQDDYWLPEKLSISISALKNMNEDEPAMYYSNTILADAELNYISMASNDKIFTSFEEAVVSSNATGCTMCFNRKLLEMIKIYKPKYQIMHDGWLHKVCLALDGNLYYDKNSYIKYRQHGNNVTGGKASLIKKWKRRYGTIKKEKCPRSRAVEELLSGYEQYMSTENIELCRLVVDYKMSTRARFRLLFSKKIYSPNFRIDIIFRLTVLLGLF